MLDKADFKNSKKKKLHNRTHWNSNVQPALQNFEGSNYIVDSVIDFLIISHRK